MKAPRDIHAALAAVRQAARQETRGTATLRALAARARLLSAEPLAGIDADELRELLELALQPGASVPSGASGEAVLAYLLALRAGRNPVAAAVDALARFDAEGESDTVAEWMREASKREAAQADALATYRATKWGPQ